MEGDLGIFTVLPESKSVHYQRSTFDLCRLPMTAVKNTVVLAPTWWFHSCLLVAPSRATAIGSKVPRFRGRDSICFHLFIVTKTSPSVFTLSFSVSHGFCTFMTCFQELLGLCPLCRSAAVARGVGRRFDRFVVPRQWHHAFVGRPGEEELVGSAATSAASGFTHFVGPKLEKTAR